MSFVGKILSVKRLFLLTLVDLGRGRVGHNPLYNKAILRKIIMPPTCVRYGFVTYLMEYAFSFIFALWEFPLTYV